MKFHNDLEYFGEIVSAANKSVVCFSQQIAARNIFGDLCYLVSEKAEKKQYYKMSCATIYVPLQCMQSYDIYRAIIYAELQYVHMRIYRTSQQTRKESVVQYVQCYNIYI